MAASQRNLSPQNHFWRNRCRPTLNTDWARDLLLLSQPMRWGDLPVDTTDSYSDRKNELVLVLPPKGTSPTQETRSDVKDAPGFYQPCGGWSRTETGSPFPSSAASFLNTFSYLFSRSKTGKLINHPWTMSWVYISYLLLFLQDKRYLSSVTETWAKAPCVNLFRSYTEHFTHTHTNTYTHAVLFFFYSWIGRLKKEN